MNTLLIDTHMNKVVMVLFENGQVIKKIEEDSKQCHSVITMPKLEELLNSCDLDIRNIHEIIVVNGPGSFTGVRIGVTIAKTISFCLNIPIKVISSLEVLAANVDDNCSKTVALNDRNGYFVGKFDKNNLFVDDYLYLSNQEYLGYKQDNKVFDDIKSVDYEKVYRFALSKENINSHLVNPLYVKKIEVQK